MKRRIQTPAQKVEVMYNQTMDDMLKQLQINHPDMTMEELKSHIKRIFSEDELLRKRMMDKKP